ncbi:MAG: hypothetical protein KIT56_00660 [Gammaproteobacteria bacterium]|nr:hypothetical protein [Gammaproteobacteria bacterium]MCW5582397.1 hypothetical protein [Gammaproteobacteria bacterium]
MRSTRESTNQQTESSEKSLVLSQGVSQSNQFSNYYQKAIVTGLMVGPISSTLTFPIDKVAFVYQTWNQPLSPTVREAFKVAFRKPFNGYFPGVLNSACKNIFLFPAKAFFERQLEAIPIAPQTNKKLSAFFAGLFTVYVSSPISVIKALRYNNLPVSQIRQLNYLDLFRGVHATALRDGVQFGVYFSMLSFISNYMSNPALSGAIAGLLGAIASNPFSVVSTNQKILGTSMVDTTVKLYKENGVRRFYPGFFKTTAIRMGVQGAATGVGIKLAETVYNNVTNRPSNS